MAIKELFQDSRPQVLFDPRASQRIDPRFKFTRNSIGTFTDGNGIIRTASANQPRFDYDPVTNEARGILLEPSRTNLIGHSSQLEHSSWEKANVTVTSDNITAPDGSLTADRITGTGTGAAFMRYQYTSSYPNPTARAYSIYAKAGTYKFLAICSAINATSAAVFNLETGTISGYLAGSARMVNAGNGWYRCIMETTLEYFYSYFQLFLTNYDGPSDAGPSNAGYYPANGEYLYLWGAQFEGVGNLFATSYIPTANGAQATRAADLLSIEGNSLPSTGSIYIDARSLTSNVNDTLLSAANASNAKLTLAIRQPASLYNSKALVYEVAGAFKPTLPFPVPSNARERNLITYGANNYHYRSDSSRLTPSSSTSVPAGMNRLGIGHDVTDPTKGFTGYINAVYLWPGEITPSVAEALVRGDVDPKNADAGVFTPATGSLAFVFNTQGTATDANRVVQLPLRGNNNNVLVDWGDNTSSSLIGAAASVTVNHTYPSAGIYPVQIQADSDGTNSALKQLQFFNNSPLDLVRVLQWGGTTTFKPTTMYRAFYGCTQMDFLTAARTNLPDTSAVTDWIEAFSTCTSITGQFPAFNTSGALSLAYAWYNCNKVTSYPQFNTSNVTNFDTAWYNNTSLTSFPSIDTSKGVSFGSPTAGAGTWRNCSGLTSFPLLDFSSALTLAGAWAGCTGLTSFPAINTASVTRFGEGNQGAWTGCTGLTSFPLLNTSNATSLYGAWAGCSSLTSFPAINTSKCQSLTDTWNNCSSLTSFPFIDTSAAVGNLGGVSGGQGTWRNCNKLTSFPAINTSGINGSIAGAWANCTSLTSFPLLDFAKVTDFGADNQGAWTNCTSLTSFPAITTNLGTNFTAAWQGCTGLTSFPTINTSNATNINRAWQGCTGLTSFPLISTTNVTTMYGTWQGCTGLTSFPLIDTSKVVYLADLYSGTWQACTGLTSFPQLNLSSVQWVGRISNAGAWTSCTGLTSFPQISFSSGLYFYIGWAYCTNLANFPAGCFSSTPGTDFTSAFAGCALTATSIQNILGDLVTANSSSGIKVLGINGGTNAGYSTWSTTAKGHLTTLQSRGWTVSYNA
jgi:hypothetical protein